MGYAVLYGDTDSLFVSAGTPDPAEARRRGEHLVSRLNRDLAEHVREAYGVVSRMELEMQCLYRRLFLPSVRHGTAGARKRYAGLVVEGGKETIHFTGMEMVRRDWTEVSKIFQRGLFERVFRGEDPGPWIREFIGDLRSGAHDDHLVYRKALRKRIAEYTATTPPHVKAAKILGARPGQIIDYVITINGPEPASARTGTFDYAHYVDKQIRPVAEAVLSHLGLDFDDLAGTGDGAGEQLDLFA
jgi:DNA polymerase-2